MTQHLKKGLSRALSSEDLVITDDSDEILNSRKGADFLEMMSSNHNTRLRKWLNKWLVPLLVGLITLAAIAIAAFVSFGVHLLR